MSNTAVGRPALAQDTATDHGAHTPGETGLWVFILGDMTLFGFFFAQFAFARGSQPQLFNASRGELHVAFGAFNTCLLLTGSLFVVWGVVAVRHGQADIARRWFTAGCLTAAWFLVDKAIEWTMEVARGITPISNDFFTYFFVFTGIYAVHVTIGLCVLGYLCRLTRRPELGTRDMHTFEPGAVYWHLVDLLWIVLFALLYLMA
jgi:nitric oxide reductase NorE protein